MKKSVGRPILLLFLICGVGFTVGRISISGFSFGVAAVLFVGIGAGVVALGAAVAAGMAALVGLSAACGAGVCVLRGHSTVFPVVMVSKIVTAALLITLLLR